MGCWREGELTYSLRVCICVCVCVCVSVVALAVGDSGGAS